MSQIQDRINTVKCPTQGLPTSRHVQVYHSANTDRSLLAVLCCLVWRFRQKGLACKERHACFHPHQVPSLSLAPLTCLTFHSWEQGTAAIAVLEIDSPLYTPFSFAPINPPGRPTSALQLALSAVVRQSADGRLSQVINDGLDGASLDGASVGPVVLLGIKTDPERKDFWQTAAAAQLRYLLESVPRTSTGALSQRSDAAQYWADGIFMAPPFLASYGALTANQSLLQMAYDNCRLYRNALIQDGPYGPLWAHIYSDDDKKFYDQGLWATGNAWAAKGMLQVLATILKSPFAPQMSAQSIDLAAWIREILDGAFPAVGSDNLIPNYIGSSNSSTAFGDAASSAALVSVAYRLSTLFPTLPSNYTLAAAKIRDAVTSRVNDMGLLKPVVNPLVWDQKGVLSTEGQAFGLMMLAAWRDWAAAKGNNG
jgi:hypothetical protein